MSEWGIWEKDLFKELVLYHLARVATHGTTDPKGNAILSANSHIESLQQQVEALVLASRRVEDWEKRGSKLTGPYPLNELFALIPPLPTTTDIPEGSES